MAYFPLAACPPTEARETNYAYWENAFTDDEISKIIELGNANLMDASIRDHNQNNIQDGSIRQGKVAWFGLNDDTNFIYERLGAVARNLNSKYFDFKLDGFVEDLQYTIYDGKGDHYTWHMDKGSLSWAPRKLSMVVQLSDPSEYDGGDLEFFVASKAEKAIKRKGITYAFPSYVMHRVTPVFAGIRKTLVVWLAGPPFQ
jgi:PKHD-type hydroxylase